MWQEQIPRIQFTARSESVNKEEKGTRRITGGVSPTPMMKQQLARPNPSRVLFVRAHFWSFYWFLKTRRFFLSVVWETSFFFKEKSIDCPLSSHKTKIKNQKSKKYVNEEKKEVETGGIDPPTPRMRIECSTRGKKRGGDWRYRSPYPSNANRMLYHLS